MRKPAASRRAPARAALALTAAWPSTRPPRGSGSSQNADRGGAGVGGQSCATDEANAVVADLRGPLTASRRLASPGR